MDTTVFNPEVPVLHSYRKQSTDFTAKQLTGFYMRVTLALNGLIDVKADFTDSLL